MEYLAVFEKWSPKVKYSFLGKFVVFRDIQNIV